MLSEQRRRHPPQVLQRQYNREQHMREQRRRHPPQLLRRLRRWWRARHQACETVASRAAKDAKRAATRGDLAAAAACSERALFTALEGATGLRARAILREQLPDKLTQAGLPAELAAATVSLLETLDAVRFTGAVGQPAGKLANRAAQLVAKLGRLRGTGRGGQGGT